MDLYVQALVMGIVQGLTEFLPISSSGHLIVVPYLLGWNDPFITSLAFSVMLHMGTLVALLAYFWHDWLVLVPAGLAAVRDRSFAGDPDRRLAWLIAVTTIPAVIVGPILNDRLEAAVRLAGIVAVTLVIGGAILWLADRLGRQDREASELGFVQALAIGVAQAVALIPGISRSGISISAGLFLGLTRESAARFSFLMATPITAAAGAYEILQLVRGQTGAGFAIGPMVVGMLAALISGLAAIHLLLRYLRTNSLTIFVVYRFVLAAVVIVFFLNLFR
ncbi:MAG: undecaprenyl-diphosphatase [Chloroflexota bacterium]|jgi:undecaprenyl-diphosphatase|nr:undecaprenyl-diphosphatase [Chloroflexota bacterium]